MPRSSCGTPSSSQIACSGSSIATSVTKSPVPVSSAVGGLASSRGHGSGYSVCSAGSASAVSQHARCAVAGRDLHHRRVGGAFGQSARTAVGENAPRGRRRMSPGNGTCSQPTSPVSGAAGPRDSGYQDLRVDMAGRVKDCCRWALFGQSAPVHDYRPAARFLDRADVMRNVQVGKAVLASLAPVEPNPPSRVRHTKAGAYPAGVSGLRYLPAVQRPFPDTFSRSAGPPVRTLARQRAARQLLHVTGKGCLAWRNLDGTAAVGPRNGPRATPEVTYNHRWGGWGSNHDRRIMRSTAPRSVRATCTDATDPGIDGTRCTGIIRRAGPRTGPRSRPNVLSSCYNAQPQLGCSCSWVPTRHCPDQVPGVAVQPIAVRPFSLSVATPVTRRLVRSCSLDHLADNTHGARRRGQAPRAGPGVHGPDVLAPAKSAQSGQRRKPAAAVSGLSRIERSFTDTRSGRGCIRLVWRSEQSEPSASCRPLFLPVSSWSSSRTLSAW